MRRTNTFTLNPGKEESAILNKWADDCARMYNEINYKRRQSFFSGNFDWSTDEYWKDRTTGNRANSLLSDWWYITKQISECQDELAKMNRKSSKRLRALYRKRRVQFRDKINKLMADFVNRCWELGVS